MPRYRLHIEYVGTRYSGWQVQENARTVQGELLRAARVLVPTGRLELYGAGRTDAGVHALNQVAHFDCPRTWPGDELVDRLNAELPADINVLGAVRADPRFHARHDAVARRYVYQLARRRTAFAKPFVWWVREPLAVGRMQEAATSLLGLRDFKSFASPDPATTSTLVELQHASVSEAGDLVLIRVQASHFLWKMVRRLVGTLVEVGKGGLAPHDLSRLLSEPSALPARLTAPASGLFLEAVIYPGEDAPISDGPALAVPAWPAPPRTRGTATEPRRVHRKQL